MTELISLFTQMLRIRLVEEEIAKRYGEQKMRCPTHLSIGQEAAAVGVSCHLNDSDRAYSSHRAHAHYLAKGGDLKKLIAELYGKSTGCTGGRGGSMHLTDLQVGFVASTAIVGNSIPLAVGNALHQKLQQPGALSVAYFGDGATEEGAFYESANFAAVQKLPVLFVCENNQYSVYTGLKDRQPEGRSIVALSNAIGVPAIEMDGNDVEVVSASVGKVIDDIRQGNGPALIECHTYRHREHCGPNWDDDLGYRPEGELARWMKSDPVVALQSKLAATPDWHQRFERISGDIQQEIEEAFAFAESSPFPELSTLDRFVYAQ